VTEHLNERSHGVLIRRLILNLQSLSILLLKIITTKRSTFMLNPLNQSVVMSLTIALGLVSHPSMAADRPEPSTGSLPSSAPLVPSSVPIGQTSDGVPQTATYKQVLVAQAQNPVAYGNEKIVGRVYNVVGSMVYLDLDDGTTTMTTLSRLERVRLGNIIGSRIVVTPYGNRANLDTTLKWTPAQATEVPPLTFSNSSPVTPPLTPRPEMMPAPVETPVETPMPVQQQPTIIPQTW
jgi:hypothetical protein